MLLSRRRWQLTPVLLPGEYLGRKSLVGYSPRGHKESDTTERLHFTSLEERPIPFMRFLRSLQVKNHWSNLISWIGIFQPGKWRDCPHKHIWWILRPLGELALLPLSPGLLLSRVPLNLLCPCTVVEITSLLVSPFHKVSVAHTVSSVIFSPLSLPHNSCGQPFGPEEGR